MNGLPACSHPPDHVCFNCDPARLALRQVTDWGKGVVLGDGRRYFRVRDLPQDHPVRKRLVRHSDAKDRRLTFYDLAEEHPDMLVAVA